MMKVPAANCDMIHRSLREAFLTDETTIRKKGWGVMGGGRERGGGMVDRQIQVRKQICTQKEEINDVGNSLNKL